MDASQDGGEEEGHSVQENGNTTPSVLKYLDRDCERARINSLVNLILTHDSGHDLIEDLLCLVDKYDLHRLSSAVLDCVPQSVEAGSSSPASSHSPS